MVIRPDRRTTLTQEPRFHEMFVSVSQGEWLYPKGYETLPELLLGLSDSFVFYNSERPHQSLGYRTPADVHQCGTGGGAAIVDHFKDRAPGTPSAPLRSAEGVPDDALGQRQPAAIKVSGLT